MAATDTAQGTSSDSRGRNATHPTDIPAKGWFDILMRTKNEVAEDNVGLVAAGIAFYGLLALFPGLGAVVAIASLFVDPADIAGQMDAVAVLLPGDAASIVTGQVKEVTGTESTGLGIAALFGIGLAIFSASKGISNLITGVNIAYDEKDERGFFHRYAVVLGLTLLTTVLFVIALALMIALPIVLSILPGDGVGETVATILRWPALLCIAIFGLAVVYRYGPDRANAKWRWISPGAILACVLWLVGTALFAVYVRTFGSYNETFGTLAGVIILLMWLWLSSYIVLIGAQFDGEMEAQTRKDTTTGTPKPLGERGATKADTVASKPA